MNRFKEPNVTQNWRIKDIGFTIIRIVLTPLFMWYRLYIWVWDGSMFEK